MNLNDANRIHDAAPDDIEMFTLSPSKRAAVCAIMELTDNECTEIEKVLDFAFGRAKCSITF